MSDSQYEMISDVARLQEVTDQCRQRPAVAIDTEFARFNTYFPIVGLIQFFDGDHCYLVDPLEIEDLLPLIDLLTDPGVVKVFHACSEDIEVFHRSLGVVPAPLFDSQVAAAALGVDFSMSYQRLVEHYLGLNIPKDETRSDWLQRPLTDAQLEYAALDVIHLLEVYEKQVGLLAAAGKSAWVAEECDHAAEDIATNVEPERAYLRLKGLARLDRESLYLVREICAWRETVARERDVPRNRIIDEKSILAIARLDYLETGGLHKHTTMNARQLRQYGDSIVELVNRARMVPEEQRGKIEVESATPVNNKLMKKLKQIVNEKAESWQVAPEMLARRRHLEALIRSGENGGDFVLPADMLGWRKTVIGDDLLKALAE
ncbi:MAG: ribonuclease D [Pseudomonadales bacterium]|nr:ribonuclease D [Pseudomonadales bacterium]